MTLGEVQGLFFGVVVAVFMVTARASQAPVVELGFLPERQAYVELDRVTEAERVPGIVILRGGAPPSFSNAAAFHDAIVDATYDADPSPDTLVLDFDTVTSIDVTAAETLAQLADELAALDVDLHLARVSPDVRVQLREQDLDPVIGPDRIHLTVRDAVEAARSAPERS